MKTCLECETDISQSHYNRKRCAPCADYIAKAQTRASVRRWKKRNPDRVREMNSSWNTRNRLRKRFTHAKDIARRRSLAFGFTYKDMLTFWFRPCTYCGNGIIFEKGIGLDRIDNKKGYTQSNVLPCCGDCNYIRGTRLTVDEMRVAMKAVLIHRRLK